MIRVSNAKQLVCVCLKYLCNVHTILYINNPGTFFTFAESMKSHCCVGKHEPFDSIQNHRIFINVLTYLSNPAVKCTQLFYATNTLEFSIFHANLLNIWNLLR